MKQTSGFVNVCEVPGENNLAFLKNLKNAEGPRVPDQGVLPGGVGCVWVGGSVQ